MSAFVNNDPAFIKWTDRLKWSLEGGHTIKFQESQVRPSMYRPFSKRFLYFDGLLNQRRYQHHRIFPSSGVENKVIALTAIASEKPFMAMMIDMITDLHLVGAGCGTQCFPFYSYNDDGSSRRENITDRALEQFCGVGVHAPFSSGSTSRPIFFVRQSGHDGTQGLPVR
jgi:predicted helicase